MARPKRTDTEAIRSRMRTVALMQELARRVGADNPNQFAKWFDEQADAATQESGKWRHNFNGNRPLSTQQLNWLSKLSESLDAHAMYQDGPSNLWRAMWTDPRDLWTLCRTRLRDICANLDSPVWLNDAPLSAAHPNDRCLGDMLREFEGELLLAEAYGVPLRLGHLTEAIALYRLYQFTNSIARINIDGGGIYRCVRMCTGNHAVRAELDVLGVYELVVSELVATEATHLAASPTYRASVSIAEADIDVYLQCPDILIRESQRWEALQFDWAP
jgi:hypothetical protein